MSRQWSWAGVLLVTSAFAIPATRAAEPPAGADPAAWALLERWADSEWVIDATWVDGSPLHARCEYRWGLNRKFLVCKTFVSAGTGEYQRYESIMAWHPEKKSLVSVDLAYNGQFSETVVELVDKHTLRQGYTDYIPGHASPARQEISFVDNDRHTWKVWVKDGSGEWSTIMDGMFVRRGK